MAYITPLNVEDYLNVDLTPNGITLVTTLIAGLSVQLENACNRAWGPGLDETPFPNDLKLALTRWVAEVFVQRPNIEKYGVSKLTQGPVTIEYDKTKAIGVDPSGATIPDYVKEVVRLHRLHAI